MTPSVQIQDEIVRGFLAAGDPLGQFTHLLQLAGELGELPETGKTEANLVRGCQSQVWLQLQHDEDRLLIHGDSDTLLVRGIIRILEKMFHFHPAAEVLATPVDFVQRTDLKDVFESRRVAGVRAIVGRIRDYARSLG